MRRHGTTKGSGRSRAQQGAFNLFTAFCILCIAACALLVIFVVGLRFYEKDLAGIAGIGELGEMLTQENQDCSWTMNDVQRSIEAGRFYEALIRCRDLHVCSLEKYGEKGRETLEALGLLAWIYGREGMDVEAEQSFISALDMQKDVLGPEDPVTLRTMSRLADFYATRKRFSEAEALYREALDAGERARGWKHPDTIALLSGLASMYAATGRYPDAEAMYSEVLEMRENVLGPDHPKVADTLCDLAAMYVRTSRFTEAENLYRQALEIRRARLGADHPDTIAALEHLGTLYETQERHADAALLYRMGLDGLREVKQPNLDRILSCRERYIFALLHQGETGKALEALKAQEEDLLRLLTRRLFARGGFRLRPSLDDPVTRFQNIVFTRALVHGDKDYQDYAARVLLRWTQFDAGESLLHARVGSRVLRDAELEVRRAQALDLRRELQCLSRTTERSIDLRERLGELEQALARRAAGFELPERPALDIEQVREGLEDEAALIVFRVFTPVEQQDETAPPQRLAALLLRPKGAGEVQFQDLGPVNRIRRPRTLASGTEAYRSLFGPFDREIRDLKRLYVVPDGLLHIISFAALRGEDGRFLVERQEVVRLHGGRDLLPDRNRSQGPGMVIFSEVDFGERNPEKCRDHVLDRPPCFSLLLDNTGAAQRVMKQYSSRVKGGGRPMLLVGGEADEHHFKKIKPAPGLLWVDSHAFLLAPASGAAQVLPMQGSGIALAWANAGRNGTLDRHGQDGLLHALELAQLHLEGTALLSVTSCVAEEGLVDYSEAVADLVWAARHAGVRSLLMPLWPVRPGEARQVLEGFYRHLFTDKDRITPAEAMHRTRMEMIGQAEKNSRVDALLPFVVIGR